MKYTQNSIHFLDLDHGVLNIIGGYIKQDNKKKIRNEYDSKATNFILNRLKKKINFIKKKFKKPL
jgi:hypothetical protein